MAGRVFISYRRDDTRGDAGRLHDSLSAEFGSDRLFKDVDNVPLGQDFREVVASAIAGSSVVLVVIGPNWLCTDDADRVRLHMTSDPVRLEVEQALNADLTVIPVLIGRTAMPDADELPDNLRGLAYRNAAMLDHDSWGRDLVPLVAALRAVLETPPPGSSDVEIDRVLELARSIDDASRRCGSLVAVARSTEDATHLAEATEAVRELSDPLSRSRHLADIYDISTDAARADLSTEALDAARQGPDGLRKATFLARLGKTLGRKDLMDEARASVLADCSDHQAVSLLLISEPLRSDPETVARALAIVRRLEVYHRPDRYGQIVAMTSSPQAMAELEAMATDPSLGHVQGNAEQEYVIGLARFDVETALNHVSTVKDPHYRSRVLSAAVETITPRSVSEALDIARSIPVTTYRDISISRVIRHLSAIDAAAAEVLIDELEVESLLDQARATLVSTLVSIDPIKSRAMARQIVDSHWRRSALRSIVKAEARGDIDTGIATADELFPDDPDVGVEAAIAGFCAVD